MSVITKHSLYSCGTIALLWGANARLGLASFTKTMAGLWLGTSALLLAIVPSTDVVNPQIYLMNSCYGTMFALGLWTMRSKMGRGGVERLLFAALALSCLQFWVRPVVVFALEGTILESDYHGSLYCAVLKASVAICSLVLAFSLIAACAKDLIDQIKLISDTDPRTGLMNRRAFDEAARDTLAKRVRTPLPVSFVIADIDHFKKVNDTYGHQVGDEVIATFVQIIGKLARESDCACRMGGEEFGILLWNSDLAGAALLVEGLRTAFSAADIDGVPKGIRFTASFGGAEADESQNFDDLYGRADARLYEAKRAGRNRVVREWCFESAIPKLKAAC